MAEDWTPDWRLLAPHRPLSPGDDAYVARPTGGGDAIAKWVIAGGSTVLVSGPTGVGKSTELAQAAQALKLHRTMCFLQADRLTNMHRLTADELMRLVANALETEAQRAGRPLSKKLGTLQTSGVNAARLAAAELVRIFGRGALLVDGLEKLPAGPGAREIFDALSSLSDRLDLVVVIPWHVAFGGGTEPILRAGERLHRVAALVTEGDEAAATADFLGRVLARRLRSPASLPESVAPLVRRAFVVSGGIPRVFLQLVADAGTYAKVRRDEPWPQESDLLDAITDQRQSFLRALLPGDTDAIVKVTGTDGRELDLERRVRLLAQGILLERVYRDHVHLEKHPLLVGEI